MKDTKLLSIISREDAGDLMGIAVDQALECNKKIREAMTTILLHADNTNSEEFQLAVKQKEYWEKQRENCLRLSHVCINLGVFLGDLEEEHTRKEAKK